ncbi:glycosyltransferase [Piscinibacter sakaiensis]|uniref:Glycosyl transferase, group 1 n=1 Tax=Piscinibacter sakaiensis TaxID=1547922 RepID=A0A0K8NU11_PISS1|nr:glycosyltransferase [Piscinibacter sakaiensis]GAP33853.1 glycosyl transferase, group 1 [Piscinibacter sakaiensis]
MSVPGRSFHLVLVCDRLDLAGGVERVVCELANHWVAAGHRVGLLSVATPRDALHYPLDPRVELLAALPREPGRATATGPWRRLAIARREWAAARALAARLRREAPQAVVLNGVTTACGVLLCAPGLAARAVCCDHNHFDARSRPWRLLRGWLYRRAAAVVSLTEADLPRFAALNPRAVLIRNAAALRSDRPVADPDGPVLAVGRCIAQKGFDRLLRAWAIVRAALPAARLRIVGDGPQRAALQAQAQALGLDQGVDWAGTRRDMAAVYAGAALFVLPSRYEGLPLALLEAQACGLPAVAFDCPTGPREVLGAAPVDATGVTAPDPAGAGGLLLRDGDEPALAAALLALLRDPARRARLGEAAWQRSRALFDREAHLAAWTALVGRVAAGEGR